jgi:hypothetical protein
MFNHYTWPFSILRIICKPYSKFWVTLLPKITIGKSLLDVSSLFALEFLNQLSKILIFLKIIISNYVKN